MVTPFEEDCVRQPGDAVRAFRELRAADDAQFGQAIAALRDLSDSHARNRWLRMLASDDEALVRFTHPSVLTLDDAIGMAAQMKAVDSAVAARFVRLLMPRGENTVRDPWHASRILEIASAISAGTPVQALLPALLKHPDVRVRSKVALMLGRLNHNVQWLEKRLADRDPRVRANAVESLWGSDSRQARELFLMAAADEHQRVVANAAVGLYRAGELESARIVERMATLADSRFRASALWAMGESLDPRFLPSLAEIVACRENGSVRQNAIRSTVRIRTRLNRLREQAPLRISAVGRQDRLEVWVRSADGRPVVGLPPTAFVVSDHLGALPIRSARNTSPLDSAVAERYEVRLEQTPCHKIRIAVYTEEWMGEAEVR